jgi:AraC-like DNA-binding protein
MTAPSTTHTGTVAAIVAFAVARGLPMEQVTEVTGLSWMDLIQPEARLSDSVVDALWRLLSEAFPGEAVGLELARIAPFSYFGMLAHAASYAEDIRGAMWVLVRYVRVLSTELHVDVVGDLTETAVQMRHARDGDLCGAGSEAALGLCARYIREVLGAPEAMLRAEFTHDPMGPVETYTEFFGTPVKFRRPANALVLSTASLDQPNRQSDRVRFTLMKEHLDALLQRLMDEDLPEDLRRIRAAIVHIARRSEYNVEALARQLGLGRRSLERVTRRHGTSVHCMLDQTRGEQAYALLKDSQLSTEEIAFLLGYSAESAFRRAFQRWSGQTPAEFRRTQASHHA